MSKSMWKKSGLALVIAAIPAGLFAQPGAVGHEFQINTYTTSQQYSVAASVGEQGELVVEAYGEDGRTDALDGLQLHRTARCGDRVHVLVRLPR